MSTGDEIIAFFFALWSAYALPTQLWFGHGCSADRMLSEHERNYGWAWMLWSSYALPTRTEVWFGHGCSGQRMLFQHERNYGLGIDALVIVCSPRDRKKTFKILGQNPLRIPGRIQKK